MVFLPVTGDWDRQTDNPLVPPNPKGAWSPGTYVSPGKPSRAETPAPPLAIGWWGLKPGATGADIDIAQGQFGRQRMETTRMLRAMRGMRVGEARRARLYGPSYQWASNESQAMTPAQAELFTRDPRGFAAYAAAFGAPSGGPPTGAYSPAAKTTPDKTLEDQVTEMRRQLMSGRFTPEGRALAAKHLSSLRAIQRLPAGEQKNKLYYEWLDRVAQDDPLGPQHQEPGERTVDGQTLQWVRRPDGGGEWKPMGPKPTAPPVPKPTPMTEYDPKSHDIVEKKINDEREAEWKAECDKADREERSRPPRPPWATEEDIRSRMEREGLAVRPAPAAPGGPAGSAGASQWPMGAPSTAAASPSQWPLGAPPAAPTGPAPGPLGQQPWFLGGSPVPPMADTAPLMPPIPSPAPVPQTAATAPVEQRLPGLPPGDYAGPAPQPAPAPPTPPPTSQVPGYRPVGAPPAAPPPPTAAQAPAYQAPAPTQAAPVAAPTAAPSAAPVTATPAPYRPAAAGQPLAGTTQAKITDNLQWIEEELENLLAMGGDREGLPPSLRDFYDALIARRKALLEEKL